MNQVKQIRTCSLSVNSFKTPAVREEELSDESSTFLFELIDGRPTFGDVRKLVLCIAPVDSIRRLHDDGFGNANLILSLVQPSIDVSMNLRSQCHEAGEERTDCVIADGMRKVVVILALLGCDLQKSK
jgi:hypothetical protein